MSEQTNIGWTDHTGGPWLVCTEVSPGCARCYARELMLKRLAPIVRKAYRAAGFADWDTRPVWGKTAPRVITKSFWSDAEAFHRKAVLADGAERPRMFPSLIDIWDDLPAGILDQSGQWLNPVEVRARFLDLVRRTTALDWLLLTKRPENIRPQLELIRNWLFDAPEEPHHKALWDWITDWLTDRPPQNVWLGASAENQAMLDERIPPLLDIPAAVHFISAEPLLEPLNLIGPFAGAQAFPMGRRLNWVIVGGESGTNRRACGVEAICAAARQCVEFDVPVYVKQDSAFKSEQQGRIPEDIWKLKQFPKNKAEN